MSIPTDESAATDNEQEEQQAEVSKVLSAHHHPSAPPDSELFDISTTVDPSYVISLIRKLLPPAMNANIKSDKGDACDSSAQGSKTVRFEEKFSSLPEKDNSNHQNDECEPMDTANESSDVDGRGGKKDSSNHQENTEGPLIGEETWEEYGCILWDLAANRTHAELMVQNLILEVLLASLTLPQSPRVTEISLGIIGNLACHEDLRKYIVSAKGFGEIIVDQLFVDDTPCLCEACRLLTMCLQGSEAITWVEALQPEPVLSRILWVAENTLNLQLIEKSVGLLLAVLESRQEVTSNLLPLLVKLGLRDTLINLLAFEMSKLLGERVPDRYTVLDLILRTIEALSVLDGQFLDVCSNRRLLQLLNGLIKFPDKVEIANSCVTAAVLVANILSDTETLASELTQDLVFLQGLLDIFPFASDDIEARSAVWSTIARLFVQVQESEMSLSSLHQYVSVLTSKSDLIEEELLDHKLSHTNVNQENLTASDPKQNARRIALRRIYTMLTKWTTIKDHVPGSNVGEEDPVSERDVDRLRDCCRKYS